MNYPGGMGGNKRRQDLTGDIDSRRGVNHVAVNRTAQSRSIDILAVNVVLPLQLADIVDRQNIGVVQPRRGSRFLFEPSQHFFISRQIGRKKLQSNMAAQTSVESQINMSHASRAQVFQNAVRT